MDETFLPITVTPDELKDLTNHLLDAPARFAIPFLNFLNGKQQAARASVTASEPPVAP